MDALSEPCLPALEPCLEPLLTLDDDDLPDLDAADFFCLLEQQDISGDLPLLPDLGAAAGLPAVPAPAVPAPATTSTLPQQQQPSGCPAAAPIIASCFAAPAALAPAPSLGRRGRASFSSSSDAFSGLPATPRSPPGSPASSSEFLPASSSGSALADLPATQAALQLTSSSSGGAPPAAATSKRQQQPHQQEAKLRSKQQIAASKRKAPEIDWRSIEDPEERRKQRRLAKNRITAARSRERKKEQVASLEERLAEMEAENSSMRALMAALAQENARLKGQLSSRSSGAAAASLDTQAAGAEPAVLKCVVIMHLAACLLCVRASMSLVVLLAALGQQCTALAGFEASVDAWAPLDRHNPAGAAAAAARGDAALVTRRRRPAKCWEAGGAGSWWQESSCARLACTSC